MITFFKDKNNKSKKDYKNYKSVNTVLESFDSIVVIGATSTSKTLSITGLGLIVLPISADIACTLLLGNKVLHKLIMNKYNKYKKRYQKDQQNIKSVDKLYRKTLQVNIIHKDEYESLCDIFNEYVEEKKMNPFYKHEYKNKIKILVIIKEIFSLEHRSFKMLCLEQL